ncbi:MAG: kinase-like domain-containing protein [Benjaminiella poitrasii]|nr:MAG: kinase-like domain-containing protein [Benjaminiella poitrasii]
MKDLLEFPSLSSFTVTSSTNNQLLKNTNKQKKKNLVQYVKLIFNNNSNSNNNNKKHPLRSLSYYGYITGNQVVGIGAFAAVHLLTTPKQCYAVKIFYATKKRWRLKKSVTKQTIMNEFYIASSLNHRNIVKTYDLVLWDNRYYCSIMEYCSGGDLYSFLKEGKMKSLTVQQINDYLKQVLEGVGYLHSIGIAHRDIKPENILLEPLNDNGSFVLKITDFGEAASQHEGTIGMRGTKPYMAPEVFGRDRYDLKSADMWSVGVLYFSMRLDGFPFGAAEMTDYNYRLYLQRFKWRAYPVFTRLDDSGQTLLYGLLNPNPQERLDAKAILNLSWMK